jgi:diadenosine tetraphosphate (Ap4A) HIT family hydrolase
MFLLRCIPLLCLIFVLASCAQTYENTSPLAIVKRNIQQIVDHEGLIFETEHWDVVIKDDQTYLGSCTLRLKRVVGSFSALSEEEWLELHQVMRALEQASISAFGATLSNWRGLMNGAYQIKPYMPLVHVHFTPRYEKPASFAGEIWVDTEFGKQIRHGTNRSVNNSIKRQMIETYRAEILSQKNILVIELPKKPSATLSRP